MTWYDYTAKGYDECCVVNVSKKKRMEEGWLSRISLPTSRQRCGLDCTGSSRDRIVCTETCFGAESLRVGEKQKVEIKDFSLICWEDGSAINWTGKGWGECRFGENFGFRDICLVWLLDTHVEMSDRQLNVKSQAYGWYLWVNSKRRKHSCI